MNIFKFVLKLLKLKNKVDKFCPLNNIKPNGLKREYSIASCPAPNVFKSNPNDPNFNIMDSLWPQILLRPNHNGYGQKWVSEIVSECRIKNNDIYGFCIYLYHNDTPMCSSIHDFKDFLSLFSEGRISRDSCIRVRRFLIINEIETSNDIILGNIESLLHELQRQLFINTEDMIYVED